MDANQHWPNERKRGRSVRLIFDQLTVFNELNSLNDKFLLAVVFRRSKSRGEPGDIVQRVNPYSAITQHLLCFYALELELS